MTAPLQQIYLAEGKWDPSLLGSAVQMWYKADLIAGSNGDPQSTIVDSSGNARNLTQTGSNRATLAAADLNSKNTLRFDVASSQNYPFDGTSFFSGFSAGSMYVVYKGIGTDVNTIMSAGNSPNESHYPYSDNNFYVDFGSTTRKSCGAATNAVTVYRILSINSATSDWAIFVDGGTGGSGGGTSALFSTATNTVGFRAGTLYLGRSIAGGPLYFNGWIAEVLITNAKQSTADRQKMEGYLAWKWGLTGNLSSSHPYKSAPP